MWGVEFRWVRFGLVCVHVSCVGVQAPIATTDKIEPAKPYAAVAGVPSCRLVVRNSSAFIVGTVLGAINIMRGRAAA